MGVLHLNKICKSTTIITQMQPAGRSYSTCYCFHKDEVMLKICFSVSIPMAKVQNCLLMICYSSDAMYHNCSNFG